MGRTGPPLAACPALRSSTRRLLPVLGTVAVVAAVVFVYREAIFSYYVDDDFHWLQRGRRFEWVGLLQLERFDHFYRPVIEIYFAAANWLLGCGAALPLHAASVGIHLLNTSILGLFAWRLTADRWFAWMTVVLFAVQPAFHEAVAWVAAITDLMPALWFLLTLLLHLVNLQTGRRWSYAASLATFATCLLTHESAAMLLPVMIALHGFLWLQESVALPPMRRLVLQYAPFACLLAAFLLIAYIVNSRSYLVREGYYAFGPHAVTNALHYIVALYVGRRTTFDYTLIALALVAIVLFGTLRMRFFLALILLTLLPVLFFTWGIASRYLYMPAAGFALLLAELLHNLEHHRPRVIRPSVARGVVAVVGLFIAVRFAAFAEEGSAGFRERTEPSARLTAALRTAHPSLPADRRVAVDAAATENILELYRDPLAEEAFCATDVRVVVRP